MLRLIINNDDTLKRQKLSKDYQMVIQRIVGLTSGNRSIGEWKALLLIFRWITKDLENKVTSMSTQKLRIIK